MHKPSTNTRFAILASGRGSNAQALMKAFERGFFPAELALVLSNKPKAGVLQIAQEYGYPAICLPHENISRQDHEEQILTHLKQAHVDHILLAGYMRILSPNFLLRFKSQSNGHILNIHPSLLPDFPGLHAVERQHASARPIAGATVHFVTDQVDSGPVILQGSIELRGDENVEELKHRIRKEVEHVIYPRALRLFLDRIANPTHQEVR